jgi:GT2 family glycosyltransferase
MKMPRVAVVILNWNGADDTIRCVESVQALPHDDVAVLVVDNGSTDDSVQRIRRELDGVELVQTGANLGFAGGCNAGIRRALQDEAAYVWLLNNDTIVEPGALSALVHTAEADPGVGAVGSVLRYMHDPGRVQTWGGGWHHRWIGAGVNWTRPVPGWCVRYLVGASLLVRSAAFRHVGLLDDGYFMYREDTDFSVRLRRAGWRLGVARDAVVYHAVGGSSDGGAARDRWIAASAVRYYRKHAPVPLLALAVETAGKIAMRVRRREWERVEAVWNGTRRAWRALHSSDS